MCKNVFYENSDEFFTGSYCVFEKYIYLCTAIERDSE